MKRYFFTILAVLSLTMVVAGCNKTAAELDIIDSPDIAVDGDAGIGTITFTTNKAWTASCQEEWVHLSPTSGYASNKKVNLTVTCDHNPTTEVREAVVTITAGDVSKTVTVRQQGGTIAVTRIELSQSETMLKLYESLQLTATVYPENATDKTVIWSVPRGSYAVSVSEDGLVWAEYTGQAYVTASCGDVKAQCLVTVYDDITIYVYDGLEWGSMRLYGCGSNGEEAVAWPGKQPDGTASISGNTFYKFVLDKDWMLPGLSLTFNDGANNRTTQYTNAWSDGATFYVHVTGPLDDEGYAAPVTIADVTSFDPHPSDPNIDPYEPPADAIYYEGFHTTNEWTAEWTFIDADGDGFNWLAENSLSGHDRTLGVLASQSFDNASEAALTPDNWAFTPAIHLSPEENYLSFWVCGQDASYALDHYAVYVTEAIPTSGNIASQCTIIMEGTVTQAPTIYTKAQSTWEFYCAPIPSEFSDKDVYIGFRHFNSTDNFVIDIDDVLVTPYEMTQQ